MNWYNWYWLADDGRLYSSASQSMVSADNPAYVAWCNSNTATIWPRDDAGNQTDEALQEVLRPYGIFVNLAFYTGGARQKKVQGDIIVNGLRFSTDPLTMGSLNSASIYAQGNAGGTFAWKLPDGSFVTLNDADVAALQNATNEFAQNCFKCEDTTLDGIEAGTVTTRGEVDAAFAAINNSFTGLRDVKALNQRHGPKKASKAK
jgi:hypothetical protein